MKKKFAGIRDTLIAGLFFLLPLLVLIVVLIKVFHIFSAVTTKLAAVLGLKDMIGISASTLVGLISFVLLCLLCGYLIRIAFFRHISKWVDLKLRNLIPGYELYHTRVLSKLDNNAEGSTHETAAWIDKGEGVQPGFIMDIMRDGKFVVFLPSAGNIQEGEVLIVEKSKVKPCPEYDRRSFRLAIDNLGLGLSKLEMK